MDTESEKAETETTGRPIALNAANLAVHPLSGDGARGMDGIHVTRRHTEATDGRAAIRVSLPDANLDVMPEAMTQGAFEGSGVTIPVDAAKRASTSIPKAATPALRYVVVTTDDDVRATLTTGDFDTVTPLTTRVVDGDFPDLNQVWPKDAPTMIVNVDPHLLRSVLDVFCRVSRKTGIMRSVRMEFRPVPQPIMISFVTENGQSVEALVMPYRAVNVPT